MEKIRWVEIENFRNFSYLKMEGLGDVNIIVGKNNTGKSTFLEALFLSIDSKTAPSLLRSTLETIFKKRGISPSLLLNNREEFEDFENLITNSFFHQEAISTIATSLGKIKIEKKRHRKEIALKIIDKIKKNNALQHTSILVESFLELSKPEKVNEIKIGEDFGVFFLEGKVLKNDFQSLIVELMGSNDISNIFEAMNIPTIENGTIFIYEKKSDDKNKINYKLLIDNSLLFSQGFVSPTIWGSLLKKMEKYLSSDVYSNLKKIISPFFTGKVKSIYPSLSDIYIATENEKIPFSLVGDGIKHLTLNYFALNLDKPTYLFLEEPETFLHPKMMKVLSKEIVRSGKRNQIFLTTHSLEFVEYLLYYAKKIEDVDVKVLGFYDLKNGKLDYEIYNYREAYSIVNKLGEDIR
ncbi:MAG: hypothetical protein C6I01_00835 [Epsilonproteobacteria bacterium]|nr:hypothetical protein [Campylobacterota bacterium]NPA88593.1 AAA family ATPase [Campylobacterota bacterium]